MVREIKEVTAVYVFKKIPTGNYATAVFQNVNSDGKINKNLAGVSKSHYGMFGPPDVADAAFEVVEDKSIALAINLESFPKRSRPSTSGSTRLAFQLFVLDRHTLDLPAYLGVVAQQTGETVAVFAENGVHPGGGRPGDHKSGLDTDSAHVCVHMAQKAPGQAFAAPAGQHSEIRHLRILIAPVDLGGRHRHQAALDVNPRVAPPSFIMRFK